MMENTQLAWGILLGVFALFQLVLTAWSFVRLRSILPALATLLFPFAGLPWTLWKLRDGAKDNQVAGIITYLGVILASAYFLWKVPLDERPWMVIYTMQFFAGLGVLNIINLSVEMRIKGNGGEPA
jgi:hypothetical protein